MIGLGTFEEAAACLDQAITLNGHVADLFVVRAKVRWALGLEQQGNADIRRAHALEPAHPEVRPGAAAPAAQPLLRAAATAANRLWPLPSPPDPGLRAKPLGQGGGALRGGVRGAAGRRPLWRASPPQPDARALAQRRQGHGPTRQRQAAAGACAAGRTMHTKGGIEGRYPRTDLRRLLSAPQGDHTDALRDLDEASALYRRLCGREEAEEAEWAGEHPEIRKQRSLALNGTRAGCVCVTLGPHGQPCGGNGRGHGAAAHAPMLAWPRRSTHPLPLSPSLPRPDADLALSRMTDRQWSAAVRLLNAVIQLETEGAGAGTDGERVDPRFYVNRGDCHRELGSLQQALADYHRAQDLAPGDWTVATRLSVVHDMFGVQLFNEVCAMPRRCRRPTAVHAYTHTRTHARTSLPPPAGVRAGGGGVQHGHRVQREGIPLPHAPRGLPLPAAGAGTSARTHTAHARSARRSSSGADSSPGEQKFAAAHTDYRRALELDPGCSEARVRMGQFEGARNPSPAVRPLPRTRGGEGSPARSSGVARRGASLVPLSPVLARRREEARARDSAVRSLMAQRPELEATGARLGSASPPKGRTRERQAPWRQQTRAAKPLWPGAAAAKRSR